MQLQMIFDEIAQKQMERKQYEGNYKTALKNCDKYQLLLADLNELKTTKFAIESSIKHDLGNVIEKLEDAKEDISVKKLMMTDQAMSDLMSGKTVVVKDKKGIEYVPVWSVKFEKVK